MTIVWKGAASANFGKGRQGNTVKKIVIHWIVGRLAAADATFQDPKRVASAHYGVGGTSVHQYVKEEDTAYHAGNLTVNRQSIGIEHEGGPDLPVSEATYKTSATLIADICRRYSIPVDRAHIIKHSEVKATQCPGTLDIDKLINMVTAIVAPVADTGLQKELDKARAARDSHWNDLMTIKNTLNLPGEFSITTVVAEIEKLIKYEDAVREKEKQLDEVTEQANELQTKFTDLSKKHSQLLTKYETLEKDFRLQGEALRNYSQELDRLRQQVGSPEGSSIVNIIANIIGKLFRK